mmetsp:Transcript_13244/g.17321  ORF Transcript_13244/g.17321 Transcript_13244/m.17321 type:complete len:226 (+) Transcript_13244:150-827(+)
MNSDNVHGDYLSSILIVENLGNTITLSLGKSLGVSTEVTLALSKSPTLCLGPCDCLLLSRSNHSYFRVCETGSRDSIVVNDMFTATNIFNCRNTLRRGSMCKHHFSVCISNAVNIWDKFSILRFGKYTHFLVNSNKSTERLDSSFLQSHVSSIRNSSGGNHGGVNLNRLDMLLGFSVDHFNGHWFLSRDSRGYLRGKNASPEINCTWSNKKAISQLGDFSVKSRH